MYSAVVVIMLLGTHFPNILLRYLIVVQGASYNSEAEMVLVSFFYYRTQIFR